MYMHSDFDQLSQVRRLAHLLRFIGSRLTTLPKSSKESCLIRSKPAPKH